MYFCLWINNSELCRYISCINRDCSIAGERNIICTQPCLLRRLLYTLLSSVDCYATTYIPTYIRVRMYVCKVICKMKCVCVCRCSRKSLVVCHMCYWLHIHTNVFVSLLCSFICMYVYLVLPLIFGKHKSSFCAFTAHFERKKYRRHQQPHFNVNTISSRSSNAITVIVFGASMQSIGNLNAKENWHDKKW